MWLLIVLAVVAEGESSPVRAAQEPTAPASLRERLSEAIGLLDRRANAEGLKRLQSLLPVLHEAGDQDLLMDAHHQTCRGHFQSSEYPAAIPHCERALDLSRARKDRTFEAKVLRNMAQLHKTRGAYPEAIRVSQQAVALGEELGDHKGAARAWVGVGAALDLMGHHARALEAYERARPALEAEGGFYYDTLFNEVAITYVNLGRYEEALASYARALDGHRRSGNKFGQQTVLNNIAEVYHQLGQYERAIEHYEEGLALCREIEERRGAAFILGGLAQAWRARGDQRRAAGYALDQLQVAREGGLPHVEALALNELAELEAALGDLQRSGESFEQAILIQRQLGEQTSEGLTQAALAGVRLRQGRASEARRLALEALARQSQVPELEWKARFALARADRAAGRGDEAAAALRSSIEVIDGLRGRVLTDTGKIGYLDARQGVFHELVDLLIEKGQPLAALEVAESARSRAFLDLLASRGVGLKPAQSAALAEVRDLEAKLRAQSRTDPADDAARAELTATRTATEADLETRVRRLRSEDPELASLIVAHPPPAAEIRDAARARNATILEYLVTENRLFIWVVDRAGAVEVAAVPVDRVRLRERVGELLRRLGTVDLAALRDPRPALTALAELYRLVLAPVVSRLPADPRALVYVVPHDVLSLLPFAALVDERGRHALEAHTFVSVPAIGVLRYTEAKKQRALSAGRRHLLALADPRPPEGATVGALPGARAEVRAISARFPPERRTVLVGPSASEANAKRLSASHTVLHFAAHGLIDDSRPWDSFLVLAPGDGEDGFLRVGEAFGLDLSADLVVLSGCATGRGKLSGDGILGLTRAFLYAGTPSVVVSHWEVSDLSTAFLMDRFYAGLGAGRGKAHALRAAQLAAKARFPHPALWAAFTLVGEP